MVDDKSRSISWGVTRHGNVHSALIDLYIDVYTTVLLDENKSA